MVRLVFGGFNKANDVAVGPAAGFRVAGNFIRDRSTGRVVAAYHNHQWQVGDAYFSRYDCKEPCLVHFEAADGTPTDTSGPFSALFVADGTMYADDKLFAKFIDETLNWHSFTLDTYWPVLVIQAAR